MMVYVEWIMQGAKRSNIEREKKKGARQGRREKEREGEKELVIL